MYEDKKRGEWISLRRDQKMMQQYDAENSRAQHVRTQESWARDTESSKTSA